MVGVCVVTTGLLKLVAPSMQLDQTDMNNMAMIFTGFLTLAWVQLGSWFATVLVADEEVHYRESR